MPKRLRNKDQSERFIKTARDTGADETPGKFERAFKKLFPPKRPSKSPSDKDKK